MKKIVWILIIIAMMAGCNEARHPLLKEAADIVHQRPDSALALISRVDTASLSETERIVWTTTTSMAMPGIEAGHIITGVASGDIYLAGRLMPLRIIRWQRRLPRMRMTSC